MSSREEVLRSRIVKFYQKNHELGKSYCVKHFVAEDVSKRTIYAILKSGTIERKPGSGRKAAIMTNKNKQKLKKLFENKDDISQNDAAKKFNCSQQYISKILKSIGIKAWKKEKAPSYTEAQIKAVKSNCRWMVRNLKGKSFVLDDESYFSLSKSQMPGNDTYYSSDKQHTPPNIKYKFQKKFESKVMLYLVVSNKGISQPYFKPSGLAINQDVYQKQCLEKILVPFLRKYHSDNNFIFWPDKASSHYARKTQEYLISQNIPFVPKNKNPTNLPQCRPIEDFFGQLSEKVYKNNWKAKTVQQLQRRIRKCLKEIDPSGVQRACASIPTKLRAVADKGPFEMCH